MNDDISCTPKLIANTPPTPFLFYHKLELIYSVPKPLKLFITCGKSHTENRDLKDIGKLTLLPGCTIQTTGLYHTTYHTPTEINTTVLKHWNTFEAVQFTFTNINSTINKVRQNFKTDKLEIRNVSIPTFNQILRQAYHPSTSLSTAIHVLTWIVGIIIFILLILCCMKTELYRFCYTDIAKCTNIRKRIQHRINKRKRQHREKQDIHKRVKLMKKQFKQTLQPLPQAPPEPNIEKQFQKLTENELIEHQLHLALKRDINNYSSLPRIHHTQEPIYISINDFNEQDNIKTDMTKTTTYPSLQPLSQFHVSSDLVPNQSILQTPNFEPLNTPKLNELREKTATLKKNRAKPPPK
jgi:RecG-like helicase